MKGTKLYWYSDKASSTELLASLTQWNLRGTSVEPPWNLRGTSVEPPWNLRGTSVEPPWNLRGTSVEPLWNPCGTPVEPLWNLCGTSVEPLWNLCGTSVEPRLWRDQCVFQSTERTFMLKLTLNKISSYRFQANLFIDILS